MLTFDGPVAAFHALQDFVIDRPAATPEDVRDRLRALLKERSPVVAVTKAVELIHARQVGEHDVPEELKDWAAAAAVMAEEFGFHGMGEGGRGSTIARELRGQVTSNQA